MEDNKKQSEVLEITVLKGEKEEISEVQRVLEEAPDYFRRISGNLPTLEDAKEVFTALAPGKTYEDKFVFGVYLDNNMIGFADIVLGYPDESTAMIGLLLLSEKHQKKGLGARAYRKLEKIIHECKKRSKIQIGVLVSNNIVLPFWEKMGFTETDRKPFDNENIKTELIVLEKSFKNQKKKKISKSDFKDRLINLCGKSNLMQFPKRYKDQLVLLFSIVLNLKTNKQYSEKSINETIIEWLHKMASKSYLDHVTLRRYLVDFGLLERDPAGHQYQVAESKLAQLFERTIREVDPLILVNEFRTQREARKKERREK